MKIRQGFVSNSSTTSFCIYGKYVDIPEEHEDDLDEFIDNVDEELALYDLEDNYIVGLEPHHIEDNETGKQFKDRVRSIIEKYFGEGVDDCRWHQETHYC